MNKTQLLLQLENTLGFKSDQIKDAFAAVDRKDFVLPEYVDWAYDDHPLPIGNGATISQPTTVLYMLNLLDPKPGDKVLDIGSGSAWTTALLAHVVGNKGQVIGTEIVPELVELGKKNLKKYNFVHANITQATEIGLPGNQPYDKILGSAAAQELPKELVEQLKVGGRLVLPIKYSVWVIDKISESKFTSEEHPGFTFVPLRH